MALAALLGLALAGAAGAADEPDPGFDLKLEPAAVTATTGDKGTVSLTIAPRPGYAIDRDGPLRVHVSAEPADGLLVPRRRYRRRDAADVRADAPRFDLKYRADRPGVYTLLIDARFWVCRRYTCRAASETKQVPVVVSDPAPPPLAPDGGPAPTGS